MNRFLLPLIALVLLAGACGDGSTVGDGAQNGDVEDTDDAENDEALPSGSGLQVELVGVVSGDTLCPGDTRPCVTLDGDLTIDGDALPADEPVRVTGLLDGGIMQVADIEALPGPLDWIVDRCDDKRSESEFLAESSVSAEQMMEDLGLAEDEIPDADALGVYQVTIPEVYAVRWLSPRQVIHLGVVGDAEPHREALEELGIGEYICVVGGFKQSDIDLEQLQSEVVDYLQTLNLEGGWGAGRDADKGAISVDVYKVDEPMITDLEQRFGDAVILNAAIKVLNGTEADFETAVSPDSSDQATDDVAPTPDAVGLVARCGQVVFPSLPPDPNGFDPIDDQIQALLDETAAGPTAVESADFLAANDWSLVSRTDERIVLFGQAAGVDDGAGPRYGYIEFDRRDGVWSPSGWGGCHIVIDAPGFGPAETLLDTAHQPDPASTTLQVVINERNCASGQAPTDREVLPIVTETETAIEIVMLVEPVTGGADCQGNPWYPVTVTLQQPLGDRTVYDAHAQPPVELTWPQGESQGD